MAIDGVPNSSVARTNPIYDPRVRGIVFQLVLALIVGFLFYEAATNAIDNLRRQNIASGFGFFDNVAGFDISQRPIEFSATSTYGQAFLVGLLNTLIIGVIGIFLATIRGFLIGIARLSSNWIVARLATVYVETLRNLPLLLQLLFWYGAVLKPLPGPKQSLAMSLPVLGTPDWGAIVLYGGIAIVAALVSIYSRRMALGVLAGQLLQIASGAVSVIAIGFMLFAGGIIGFAETPTIFLNNRGLYTPSPIFGAGAELMLIALCVALVGTVIYRIWARRRQEKTGQIAPVFRVSLALLVGLPVLAYWIAGSPVTFDTPVLKGFNMAGGFQLLPEFVALLVGLVTYTAAFIAEIVRSGIKAVPKGQTEAAKALGLNGNMTLRFVTVPQAMRVIIPPLTSQYLNLVKNSSLAVAIGYPDLVQVFTGTVLNQTGQAIEVIAITMAVYLTISLFTATIMNWYNRRVALVER
jgi:general L-amino acid transport system permease protein